MNLPRRKPKYNNCNGFLLPIDFSAEAFKSALDYKPEATDTFIVTYPKCGTTWMQNLVWLLHNNGQPFPVDKSIQKEMPFLEAVGKDFVVALPSPRFIKSHLPFSLTPYRPEAKYIYVARNPFACVVLFIITLKVLSNIMILPKELLMIFLNVLLPEKSILEIILIIYCLGTNVKTTIMFYF